MKNQQIVYVPMAVDILHTGHINIIEVARKLGKITLGLLSDKAIVNYKRLPLLSIEKRKKLLKILKGLIQLSFKIHMIMNRFYEN